MCFGQVKILDPVSKYKNCSYPSSPFINFSFLLLITSLLFKATLGIVLDMFSMSPIWLLYNSIKLTLYLKFFKRSVALPNCMKFSKC